MGGWNDGTQTIYVVDLYAQKITKKIDISEVPSVANANAQIILSASTSKLYYAYDYQVSNFKDIYVNIYNLAIALVDPAGGPLQNLTIRYNYDIHCELTKSSAERLPQQARCC